jgi:ethanolamine ammonia-lyase small subunit
MDKLIKGLPNIDDPLNPLKEFTAARIAIGRAGVSIPTKQSLEFNLAHAHARDAVYSILDVDRLSDELKQFELPMLHLHSKAENRAQYLKRPDLGRKVSVIQKLIPLLSAAKLKLAPICLIEQGRVASGDKIAHLLNAKLSVMLIGERPGLSAADSIGAYLTYNPKPGLTDESRNCISNVRPHGLKPKPAAEKIFYLIQEAFRLKLSGVVLKDNQGLLNI